MAVVAATIKGLPSGEFSGVADAVVDDYIAFAEQLTDRDYFGDLADRAVTYLAAHLLSLDTQGSDASGGGVASKTAGSLSVSYGSVKQEGPSFYMSTGYGRTYLGLLRLYRHKASPRTVF